MVISPRSLKTGVGGISPIIDGKMSGKIADKIMIIAATGCFLKILNAQIRRAINMSIKGIKIPTAVLPISPENNRRKGEKAARQEKLFLSRIIRDIAKARVISRSAIFFSARKRSAKPSITRTHAQSIAGFSMEFTVLEETSAKNDKNHKIERSVISPKPARIIKRLVRLIIRLPPNDFFIILP